MSFVVGQNVQYRHYTTDDGLAHNIVNTIFKDAKGYLWFGTEGGLSRFDGMEFRNFTMDEGMPTDIVVNLSAKGDSLLIDFEKSAILLYQNQWFTTQKTESIQIPTIQKYGFHLITLIESKTKKDYLLPKDKQGIYLFDRQNNHLHDLRQAMNISSTPTFMAEDAEGNIWVATDGGGVYCIFDSPFVNYGAYSGLGNVFVNDIVQDEKGEIYAGTKNGLYHFKEEQWVKVQLSTILNQEGTEIWKFKKDRNGAIYFSSNRGIFNLENLTQCVPENFTSASFILDEYGRIYLFLEGYLYAFVCGQAPSKWPMETENVQTGYSLFEDTKAQLWMGTNQGVYIYNGLEINHLSTTDGLPSNLINDIAQDATGNIWLATEQGLAKRDTFGNITVFNRKSGLLSSKCRRIKIDERGGIWIASPQGLHYFEEQNILPYNAQTGLVGNDINCLFSDQQQRIWVGTSQGVSMCDISDLPSKSLAPIVHIEQIRLNDKHTNKASLKSLPFHSKLTIDYAAITFSNPRQLVYEYRLKETDIWQVTKNRSLDLLGLNAGNYKFQLRAKKINSDWSEPISIGFRLEPPIWRKWWFVTSMLFALIGLVFGAVSWRIRRIKEAAAKEMAINKQFAALELNALQSQMNPHFLFNSLNAIQNFILKQDTRAANESLTNFARLVRLFLESSKSKFIKLSDEINLLTLYLEMEKMCYEDKFDFKIKVDQEIEEEIEIPTMFIQPFTENAIRHGILNKEGKGKVVIDFSKKEEALYITIIDDGVGRKEAEKLREINRPNHKSHGIELLMKRAEALNFTNQFNISIKIEDVMKGKLISGTKVVLKITNSNWI